MGHNKTTDKNNKTSRCTRITIIMYKHTRAHSDAPKSSEPARGKDNLTNNQQNHRNKLCEESGDDDWRKIEGEGFLAKRSPPFCALLTCNRIHIWCVEYGISLNKKPLVNGNTFPLGLFLRSPHTQSLLRVDPLLSLVIYYVSYFDFSHLRPLCLVSVLTSCCLSGRYYYFTAVTRRGEEERKKANLVQQQLKHAQHQFNINKHSAFLAGRLVEELCPSPRLSKW